MQAGALCLPLPTSSHVTTPNVLPALMHPDGRPSQLLAWLAGHGLEGDRGLQTFRRYPNLAGCSIERKLEPAVGFVKERLGLSDVAVAKARPVHACLLRAGVHARPLDVGTACALPAHPPWAGEGERSTLLVHAPDRHAAHTLPSQFILAGPDMLCRTQATLQSIFDSFLDAGFTHEQLCQCVRRGRFCARVSGLGRGRDWPRTGWNAGGQRRGLCLWLHGAEP